MTDISVPESAALVGGVDTPGGASGIAVTGNYAYEEGGFSGLYVIDTGPKSCEKA